MRGPDTPTYNTLNWPSSNMALERRRPLTVWFDPDMAWPTGKLGRQPVCSAAAPDLPDDKVLFGMARRQTTGRVKRLLCRIGPDRGVPDFSTLSRRRKALAVNSPHRGRRVRGTC